MTAQPVGAPDDRPSPAESLGENRPCEIDAARAERFPQAQICLDGDPVAISQSTTAGDPIRSRIHTSKTGGVIL